MQNTHHDQNDHTPVYSSQDINRDYLTLRGIELKTGIKKEDIYTAIIGEMLDNSIDYIETHGVTDPQVYVTISTEENSLLKITIRNSVNSGSNHVFSKKLLESIYNPSTYHSSKRIYKINRGALGDASKLMLGAPYALADKMNIDLAKIGMAVYPITHKTSTKNVLQTFHVSLSSEDGQPDLVEEKTITSKENYTEVQILLPYDITDDNIERRILLFLRDYALLNTHIGFTFDFLQCDERPIYSPARQPMINSGKNLSSIHFYDLSEFRQIIRELHDKNQTIYDVLQKTFREASNLPKNDLTQTTVGELQNTPTKIEEVSNQLRKMPAISEETGLSSIISFSTSKKTRRKALEDRLIQAGISCKLVKYKQKHGYYKSDDKIVEYPYFFEVFVGHSNHIVGNLKVIQSINSKISNNSLVFGGPYNYDTSSDKYYQKASSIFDIFGHYKYSYDEKKCKKPHSIIIVNLISPRIAYKSHGKSRIDETPFAKIIASTIVDACKGGSDKNGKPDRTEILKKVLEERKDKYLALPQNNLIILKKHEWTQSDVFYATRKRLIEAGYDNEEIDRDYITGLIGSTCLEKLNVTREQIGIFAADRAQLYFKGKWSDVGLDEIDEQVHYGTDMVIIEKEGVISQIGLFADGKGIALLNTRGFLTEYASKLAKLAGEKGCNIAILTDFDVSGLWIFMKVRKEIYGIKRIGIDFETVKDLGLEIKDVEEEYKAPEKHLKALEAALEEDEEDDELDFLRENLGYLKTKRIEINSIMTELDDNAVFWGWIAQKLRDIFPDRDFNRSVDIPEYVMPMSLQELNDMIEEKGKIILKDRREKLQERLSNSGIENAFLFDRTNNVLPNYNIKNYDAALAEQSRSIIENDPDVKPKLEEIEKLLSQPQKSEEEKKGEA